MNPKAMNYLSYGMYILTAREGWKDNGCVINTAIQVTGEPPRISISVNKTSCTHGMILRTGVFNISVLTHEAPYPLLDRFGFRSGKNIEKFELVPAVCKRSPNGLYYFAEAANAYISAKVEKMTDLGSHTLFIGEVTDMEVLNDAQSVIFQFSEFDNQNYRYI